MSCRRRGWRGGAGSSTGSTRRRTTASAAKALIPESRFSSPRAAALPCSPTRHCIGAVLTRRRTCAGCTLRSIPAPRFSTGTICTRITPKRALNPKTLHSSHGASSGIGQSIVRTPTSSASQNGSTRLGTWPKGMVQSGTPRARGGDSKQRAGRAVSDGYWTNRE